MARYASFWLVGLLACLSLMSAIFGQSTCSKAPSGYCYQTCGDESGCDYADYDELDVCCEVIYMDDYSGPPEETCTANSVCVRPKGNCAQARERCRPISTSRSSPSSPSKGCRTVSLDATGSVTTTLANRQCLCFTPETTTFYTVYTQSEPGVDPILDITQKDTGALVASNDDCRNNRRRTRCPSSNGLDSYVSTTLLADVPYSICLDFFGTTCPGKVDVTITNTIEPAPAPGSS